MSVQVGSVPALSGFAVGKGRLEEAPSEPREHHQDDNDMEHMVLTESPLGSERLTAEWLEAERAGEERVDAKRRAKRRMEMERAAAAAAGLAGGSRRASIDLASLNRIRGASVLTDSRGDDVSGVHEDLLPKIGRERLNLLDGDSYLVPLNGGGYNVVQRLSSGEGPLVRDAAGNRGDGDSGGGANQRKQPLRRSVSSANQMPRPSLACST